MTPPLNTPVPVSPIRPLPTDGVQHPNPSPLEGGKGGVKHLLDFSTPIVTLGSCFSDEIGTRLKEGGFRIEANPFGTLYNPASIADALDRIIACREVTEADLVQHEGLWHSWHHHGSFSHPTIDETLEACNASLHRAHEALQSARLLMTTFGTAWVFELNGQGVVANCHKLPADNFVRHKMSVEEIVSLWKPLLERLTSFNPQLSTLFTVSPIRHMADGAHGNQLSKATLLLAVEQLASCGHYFPSYEIILDELRDYRFFGPDMTHPSPLAVDIVYDRFQQATMSPATIQQAHNNAKAARRQRHIPLHAPTAHGL